MANMFASSVIDWGFNPESGQPKDFKICSWCFSTSNDLTWSARNQDMDKVSKSGWLIYLLTVVSVS